MRGLAGGVASTSYPSNGVVTSTPRGVSRLEGLPDLVQPPGEEGERQGSRHGKWFGEPIERTGLTSHD
jgi:hypothetical protein